MEKEKDMERERERERTISQMHFTFLEILSCAKENTNDKMYNATSSYNAN